MIRRLFTQYRWQIALAFALVIFENIAYIAEPFVFGKAIDGLREARQVEDEVDSSITTLTLKQVADSVRAHIFDSLHTADSLRVPDSLLMNGGSVNGGSEKSSKGKGILEHRYGRNPISAPVESIHLLEPRSQSKNLFHLIAYQEEGDSADEEIPATSYHISPDSMRRSLARRDSIRSHQAKKKSLLGLLREVARDSLRKQISERPPAPIKPRGTISNRPVGFYVPRDVGPFLPPLIPWVLLFLINSSLGAFRRIYDTRIYTKMFANLSSEVVARQLAQGEELSKIAARSSMAWHNIEFFQYNVPEFLEQLIAVGGAVIALGLFDWRLTVVGTILILCVMIGSKYYMRLVTKVQVALHDKYELEYDTFATREPAKIRQYYSDIADLEITQSQRSTVSYSVIRVFLLCMFLTTLYISIDLDRFTIGALYSIVAYVWSFVTATEYVPYLSEKWVELKDASRRIAMNDED